MLKECGKGVYGPSLSHHLKVLDLIAKARRGGVHNTPDHNLRTVIQVLYITHTTTLYLYIKFAPTLYQHHRNTCLPTH